MKIGFYNYYRTYNNNRMFMDMASPIGDNLSYPFVYLREYAKNRDIHVSTIDTEPLDSYDAIVFLDFPQKNNKYFKNLIKTGFKNIFLVLCESEIIRPDNYDIKNHKYFKKIFTWKDNLVDNEQYLKYFLPNKIQPFDISEINCKKKLVTLIAGHKYHSHPKELYSERINAIRWFEKNHPNDFDLYGFGWDEYRFGDKLSIFNYDKLKFIRKRIRQNFPSHVGSVESKHNTLKNYKFAICYENAIDISGYITEKIFDCFFAGCIPIYLGPKNVYEQIPENTFIDKRKFGTYEELYSFISQMSDDEYMKYIENIGIFLNSDRITPFSAEYFAETLIDQILMDV